MAKKKKFISYLLVLMFGVLFLKNLLPDIGENGIDNCDEIGHIHLFHVHIEKTEIPDKLALTQQPSSQDHDDCHGGKGTVATFNLPNDNFKITVPGIEIAFNFVFNIQNNFQTPYLEPHRKPPRFS